MLILFCLSKVNFFHPPYNNHMLFNSMSDNSLRWKFFLLVKHTIVSFKTHNTSTFLLFMKFYINVAFQLLETIVVMQKLWNYIKHGRNEHTHRFIFFVVKGSTPLWIFYLYSTTNPFSFFQQFCIAHAQDTLVFVQRVNLKCNSPEQTTRSFPIWLSLPSEVVFASTSSF